MFGIKEFTSIINPPQNGILSVGVGEQRPMVKDGELAIATVMSVTLAMDHRRRRNTQRRKPQFGRGRRITRRQRVYSDR
jgi:hypothetical protein